MSEMIGLLLLALAAILVCIVGAHQSMKAHKKSLSENNATSVEPAVLASTSDDLAKLKQLGRLRDDGVLTAEEFEKQKAAILGTRR